MKARSRLKAVPEEKPSVSTSTIDQIAAQPFHSTHRPQRSPIATSGLKLDTRPYVTHIGTLFLGLVFGFMTIVIMRNWHPARIANWLLPHSYLPFQIATFLTIFFLASFLWLNTRRGYLTAICLQTLIFLKLQNIQFSWVLGLGIVTLFVIIEILFAYFVSHASLNQKSHPRHRRARA